MRQNSRKNIVVFAGAGASYAVDPDNFPTTERFFSIIEGDEDNNERSILESVSTFLRRDNESRIIDVEQVLWILDETADAINAITNKSQASGFLISPQRQQSTFGKVYCDQSSLNKLLKLQEPIHRLKNYLNSRIFDVYSVKPAQDLLLMTWMPFIEGLISSGFRFDLFTTNYDIVLEEALTTLGKDEMLGMSGPRYEPVIDLTKWINQLDELDGSALLTKLHGSVNWHYSPNQDSVYASYPQFDDNLNNRTMIFPGFKGVPEREPFMTFHRYFEKTLNDASVFIVIGFAFRDEYINRIIRDYAQSTPLIIIDPGNVPEYLDFLNGSNVTHIQEGFSTEILDDIWKLLNMVEESGRVS